MGRWRKLAEGKDLVESKKSISVFELKPQHVLKRHFAYEDIPCESGGFWFYRKYDPLEKDFYLEMRHRGPKNNQSTINFLTTPCYYGGERWWFECPRCERRVAKLYEKNDDFYCRICLDLEYLSHRVNYRSLEPIVRRMLKLEKMELKYKIKHQFYGRKLTKRATRYEKLRWQVDTGSRFALARLRQ